MGFLKFLKREKKQDFDELDMPPEPPPIDGFEGQQPGSDKDFGDFDKDLNFDFPELDENAEVPEMKFNLDEPEEKMPVQEGNYPDFPQIGSKPMADIPPITAPLMAEQPELQPFEVLEEPAAEEQHLSSPKMSGGLFRHRPVMRERPAGKTIYVKVDSFKAMLGTINMARNSLKASEDALAKLENIKMSKDKSFDKVKISLEDLQKKLIFIDKTLFKGE